MLKFVLFFVFINLSLGNIPKLKIIGGEDADIKDYPYQVSLLWYQQHVCGASILSENWIVTAGHCIEGSTAEELHVRANSSIVQEGGQLVNVKRVFQHPNYDWNKLDYDISILELAQPLLLGEGASPIQPADADSVLIDGENATVTGWGATDEGNYYMSKQLQVITVPIVNKTVCSRSYIEQLTDRMFCAGYEEGGKDACTGDSGGPLVIDGKLAGIVSWGNGCARPRYYGVYARVAVLRDYIKEITGI